MRKLGGTAAICTSLAVATGCSTQQAPLRVPEAILSGSGRYTVTLEDTPENPSIIPSRIVTDHGVFERVDGLDVQQVLATHVGWKTQPDHKIEAFGGTYYKLDDNASQGNKD